MYASVEDMNYVQLLDTINAITARSQSLHLSDGVSKEAERLRLLTAAGRLVCALENPQKTMIELAKGPAAHAALRTALMLNLFEGWPAEEVKAASGLAEQSGAEESLIVRIMRALVGIGIFEEKEELTYRHNGLSQTLMDQTFRTLVTGMSSSASLTMGKLPEYLASTSYRNPIDPEHSLFQFALDTKLNMFQWLKTQPEQLAMFSAYQAAATKIRGRQLQEIISSLFPKGDVSRSHSIDSDSRDQLLLVDVGAGRGQALRDVRAERPDLVGRMVVQDLPEVIAGREEVEGVKNMVHDFFTPQPIKGASVYFFCHIFHDWPDFACRQILENTIPALEADLSRIVIVDQVLPDTNASAFAAMMDLTMMTFGGMERAERQWRELLEGVGLNVVSLKLPEVGSLSLDGVIVAKWKS